MRRVYLLSITALLLAVFIAAGLNKYSLADEKAITKAKDGYTVEELYTKKAELKGKRVSVRGKAVRFAGGIMGKNFIHLQDGSGQKGTNDITVTTNQSAKVGDIVLANGLMVLDRDFGGGYRYPVILEEATITVE